MSSGESERCNWLRAIPVPRKRILSRWPPDDDILAFVPSTQTFSSPVELSGMPDTSEKASAEEAMLYCPICSTRLDSRRCKLFCTQCGYYMSCADYY